MKKRSNKLFIKDIITFFDRIEEYTKDFKFEDFIKNQMLIDAVVRNLELIGEASNNISKKIQDKYSQIPWSEMIGLRTIAAHRYFKLDLNIIWDIITKDIPETKEKFKNVFDKLFSDEDF